MTDTTPRPRRNIWIVSARVGAGHVQAAKAVEEACAAIGLSDRVRSVDLLTLVPGWFRKVYAGGYARMATKHARLFGKLYHFTDRSTAEFPTLSERIRVRMDGRTVRPLIRLFDEDPPDVILHTHFLAPAPIARWISDHRPTCRHGVVVTDFHPHRIWLAPRVDRYFVAADMTRDRLVQLGIDPASIEVSGIPILAKHSRPTDRHEVYRAFDWRPNMPAILVLAGSDFVVGPFEQVVDDLLMQLPNATIQVATGKNEVLHKSLEQRLPRNPNLRLIGFTDRMNELFAAATLVVSKTGGITTSECLAAGAAVVGLFPVPGQEELNADYLVANGAGIKVTRRADVAPSVKQLLDDPAAITAMKSKSQSLGCPQAAQRVADWIRQVGSNCG